MQKDRIGYFKQYRKNNVDKIKRYYKLHKDTMNLQSSQYRLDNKKEVAKYMKKYRKKHRAYIKKQRKQYRINSRNEVVYLYSKGTMLCPCGAHVDDNHHTNPKDGNWERIQFNSSCCTAAWKYQIKMYAINPNYIKPLCSSCHVKEHIKLRKV